MPHKLYLASSRQLLNAGIKIPHALVRTIMVIGADLEFPELAAL